MSTTYTWMMQIVAETKTHEEAAALLPAMVAQEGCVSARIIGGHGFVGTLRVGSGIAVQAFFPDMGEGVALPDGCRRVLVPSTLLAA